MNETLLFLLLAAVCMLIGAFLGNLFARLKLKTETGKLEERINQLLNQEEKLQERIGTVEAEREAIRSEKDSLNNQLVRTSSEYDGLQNELSREREKFKSFEKDFEDKFQNLANKILDEKSSKFTKQNKESLEVLLNPLQEKIKFFEKRVEDTNKENVGRHSELKEQLKHLSELNQQMSKDADNLTKALKGDSKMQGNWGELILTRILEKSGLEKGREYTVQDSYKSEDGKRHQTDVIVHLPDGKKMVIDSKVSLTNFERFVSEENDDEKKIHLKKHIDSIKSHIKVLSDKNYQSLVDESPDTVFMFIPIEPAFAIASAHEPNLYEQAFDKQVIIVTPATLLAALRLVDNLWQNDIQKKNTQEIVRQATNLYDKFRGLVEDLNKVGQLMDKSKESYSSAMNKLHSGRGNLISRVENLKKLRISPTKSIPMGNVKRASQEEE